MPDAPKTDKTDKPDAAEATDAPTKKKSKLIPIVLAVGFVLLAGGGAGGYWMYSKRAPSTEPEAANEEKSAAPGVLDMEPFVVNLADEGGGRFLRVNMKLLTWSEEQAAELKEDPVANARIRSAILELLSLQSAAPLITPEGKEELKQVIAERVVEVLGHEGESGEDELKVTDVLFVEFVVQ